MFFDPSLTLGQTQPPAALQFIDNLARTQLSHVLVFVAVCTVIRLIVTPRLIGTPAHLRFGSYRIVKFVNELCDALVYAGVIVFLVIRPFGVQTFYIPSPSMENTLMTNDFIVANKFVYRVSEPQAGDIVVFRPPARGIPEGQSMTDYIKRLVGTPGQVIEIRAGDLYRDGKLVNEPYVTNGLARLDFKLVKYKDQYYPCQTVDGSWVPLFMVPPGFRSEVDFELSAAVQTLPPVAIPPGKFLMVGDNRNESLDGRFWGLVDRDSIIGKSEFIWLPVNRWQQTR